MPKCFPAPATTSTPIAGVVVGVVEGAEHLVDGVERHGVELVGLVDGDARDAAAELGVGSLLVDDLVEREALALDPLPLVQPMNRSRSQGSDDRFASWRGSQGRAVERARDRPAAVVEAEERRPDRTGVELDAGAVRLGDAAPCASSWRPRPCVEERQAERRPAIRQSSRIAWPGSSRGHANEPRASGGERLLREQHADARPASCALMAVARLPTRELASASRTISSRSMAGACSTERAE